MISGAMPMLQSAIRQTGPLRTEQGDRLPRTTTSSKILKKGFIIIFYLIFFYVPKFKKISADKFHLILFLWAKGEGNWT